MQRALIASFAVVLVPLLENILSTAPSLSRICCVHTCCVRSAFRAASTKDNKLTLMKESPNDIFFLSLTSNESLVSKRACIGRQRRRSFDLVRPCLSFCWLDHIKECGSAELRRNWGGGVTGGALVNTFCPSEKLLHSLTRSFEEYYMLLLLVWRSLFISYGWWWLFISWWFIECRRCGSLTGVLAPHQQRC